MSNILGDIRIIMAHLVSSGEAPCVTFALPKREHSRAAAPCLSTPFGRYLAIGAPLLRVPDSIEPLGHNKLGWVPNHLVIVMYGLLKVK
jgi:hypothetical protein